MIKAIILCALLSVAFAYANYHAPSYKPRPVKVIKVVKEEKPEPYEFNYEIKDEYHNQQSRQESGDAHGNVKGAYGLQLADGRRRWVEYVADGAGFRAWINTNEPGTDNQDPADVKMTVKDQIVVKEAPKKRLIKVIKKEEPRYKLVKVPVHRGYY